jgi:hypothetical protein
MTELRYPQWQKPYEEALLEGNPQKLREKLMEAENAIFLRLQELSYHTDHYEERLAINDAISGLRSLQTKKLNFPDGRSE